MKQNFSDYTNKDKNLIIKELESSYAVGLSSAEVLKRQNAYGQNDIKKSDRGIAEILGNQLKSPFLILLCAASGISFFIEGPVNASIIMAIVLINFFLGFYQEYSAHKEISLLQKLILSYVKVLRDGRIAVVQSKELVVGDIIFVEPGTIIPADIRFIDTYNLFMDESALTGESVPVKKSDDVLKRQAAEVFKASNIGFTGTNVAEGRGTGIVYAIGNQTIIADITRLAQSVVRESLLMRDIRRFSMFMMYNIIITLLLVIGAHLLLKHESIDLVNLFLFALALAVGITPEALPMVISFGLSRGARRLAKNKVIVKHLAAIEDLGSVDVLCTDKTGTLTENIMTVSAFNAVDPIKTKILAMATGATSETFSFSTLRNSFDVALFSSLSPEQKTVLATYKKVVEIPFEATLRMNAAVVQKDNGTFLIVRGSPIDVLERCKPVERKESLLAWIREQGNEGKRILAVATKELKDAQEPTLDSLEFVGLISFEDPLKKTTFAAIEKAEKLGLTIKIITGDTPEVAQAVAQQLNLMLPGQEVITQEVFDQLSEERKQDVVESHTVFSRISPENKYLIIKILQKNHKVAFLGDGINDTPALKIAHVGISVSGAVDVARQAADIILIKKSLNVIVDAIEEGRKVFVNMSHYLYTVLSSNFGNFYSIALASLMIDFLPLLPRQILLVNLLSDFPMLGIASDNVELDSIKKPTALNLKDLAIFSTIFGLINSVFDFIFFGFFYQQAPKILQTNWFMLNIVTAVILIYAVRTKRWFFQATRPSFLLVFLGLSALFLAVTLPCTLMGDRLFSFVRPTGGQLGIVLLIALGYFVTTEVVKRIYYSVNAKI